MSIFNFQFSIFKKLKNKGGFNLLETIIAIAVILVGVVGVIILMGQSARSIRVASNRIIASHLAEEAIEVVVNIRDTNWIKGNGWRTNIPSTTKGIVDYSSTSVTETNNPANYCLSLVDDFYIHQEPPCNTIFKRHVEVSEKSETIGGEAVDFIEVRAVVEWSQQGEDRSITLVNHLYDWK